MSYLHIFGINLYNSKKYPHTQHCKSTILKKNILGKMKKKLQNLATTTLSKEINHFNYKRGKDGNDNF